MTLLGTILNIISTVEENLSQYPTSEEQYASQISNVTKGDSPCEALIKTTKADLSTIVERHVQSVRQGSETAQQKLQCFNSVQVDSGLIATKKYVEAHSNVKHDISEFNAIE